MRGAVRVGKDSWMCTKIAIFVRYSGERNIGDQEGWMWWGCVRDAIWVGKDTLGVWIGKDARGVQVGKCYLGVLDSI